MKYTKELLEEAVAASSSVAGVLRHLGLIQAGGAQAHISRSIKKFGIDTSHFAGQGWSGGRKFPPRIPALARLVLLPPGAPRTKPAVLRKALLSTGRRYVCAMCGNTGTWMLRPLILHVDHIDGNYRDNRPSNLRFICPNCHSQTPTYSGRNRRERIPHRRIGQLGLTIEEPPGV